MMLQQTQVARVMDKYKEFLKKFPTVEMLAKAPIKDVLLVWQGLGYNRRALFLQRTAKEIAKNYAGKFPKDYKTLLTLPGIGQSTAGAIMAFAYNTPVAFIETNIRSVFIHEFFKDKENISDKELLPLIEKTLDHKHPRDFYYALMDYGVHLKQTENHSRKSTHYKKQTKFKGSHREARAKVLKILLENPKSKVDAIANDTKLAKEKISQCIQELKKEGFLKS